MELSQYIIVALIGISAGLLGGLLGIGGAIVIIPALVFLLGFNQQLAQGTTLVMFVMPVGALAAWQYYKAGNADIKVGLVLAAMFFIGGFFGAKLANIIPQDIMKKVFGVLLFIISIKMLFFDKSSH